MSLKRLALVATVCGVLLLVVLSTLPGDLKIKTSLPGKVEHFLA